MSSNNVQILSDCDENLKVAEIQRIILEKNENNKTLFHPLDIEKIIKDKKYVACYLRRQKFNLQNSVAMIENALIWRKEHGLPLINNLSFSRDYYEIGAVFIHEVDIENNVLLFVRAKYSTTASECKETVQRTMAYFMFTAHEKALYENFNGWTLFVDMDGVRLTDCDFRDFFNLKILVNYIPSGLKRIIIFQMPPFLKMFTKLGTSILPSEWKRLIIFAEKENIEEYVAFNQLPSYISNPGEKFINSMPNGVRDFDESDVEVIGIKNEDKPAFKQLIAKWKTR